MINSQKTIQFIIFLAITTISVLPGILLGQSGSHHKGGKEFGLIHYHRNNTITYSPPSLGDRTPLILVHGMGSEIDYLEGWDEWIDYINDNDNGRFEIYRFIYNSDNRIEYNGRLFADAFLDNYDLRTSNKTIILAHSMGGLVSRAALAYSPQMLNAVKRLVTLGTPHYGSPLAIPAWVRYSRMEIPLLYRWAFWAHYAGWWSFFPAERGAFDLAWYPPDANYNLPNGAVSGAQITETNNVLNYNQDQINWHNEAITEPYIERLDENEPLEVKLKTFAYAVIYDDGSEEWSWLTDFSPIWEFGWQFLTVHQTEGGWYPFLLNDGVVPEISARYNYQAFGQTINGYYSHGDLLTHQDIHSVVFQFLCALHDIPDDPTPDYYRVSGYVKNTSGSPIKNVKVTFVGNGRTEYTYTDRDGYYDNWLEEGWSGTVNAEGGEYTYSGPISISSLTSNLDGQNFTGTPFYTGTPDYTIISFTADSTATERTHVYYSMTVRNVGNNTVPIASEGTTIYISEDSIISEWDYRIGSDPTPLYNPGDEESFNNDFRMLTSATGSPTNYYRPTVLWQNTQIVYAAGQNMHIEVVGFAYTKSGSDDRRTPAGDIGNPAPDDGNWPGPGLDKYSIIARLGEGGEPFRLAVYQIDATRWEYDGPAPASGELFITANDTDLSDNIGSLGDNRYSITTYDYAIRLPIGNVYIGAFIDAHNEVPESDEANNSMCVPIYIEPAPDPVISGNIRRSNGDPVSDVLVIFPGAGSAVSNEEEGYYQIEVPWGLTSYLHIAKDDGADWTFDVDGNEYSIQNDQTIDVLATPANIGLLTVTIQPAEAELFGAQWRRTGTTTWHDSGDTETDIPAGNVTVEFKEILGWTKPDNQTEIVPSGDTLSLSGTYTLQTGSLSVTIEPQGARDAGAQWRRVGTLTWYDSGFTEGGIPTGSYDVEFKSVYGWDTPLNEPVVITFGGTTTASGTYELLSGSLQVNISPQGAIDAGAKWRRTGTGTWLDSGYTESGIPVGDVTIEFKTTPGWTEPSDRTATINQDETTTLDAAYTETPLIVSVSDGLGMPGDTVPISVSLSEGAGVLSFGFDLTFDPNVLEYQPPAERGGLVPGGYNFNSNLIGNSIVRVGGYSGDGETTLNPGSGVLAVINFKIKEDAATETTTELVLSVISDDIASGTIDNGQIEVIDCVDNYDVNQDGSVTPGDALVTFQHYLGISTITDPCSLLRADANDDGSITPGDALIIFQEYLGLN